MEAIFTPSLNPVSFFKSKHQCTKPKRHSRDIAMNIDPLTAWSILLSPHLWPVLIKVGEKLFHQLHLFYVNKLWQDYFAIEVKQSNFLKY